MTALIIPLLIQTLCLTRKVIVEASVNNQETATQIKKIASPLSNCVGKIAIINTKKTLSNNSQPKNPKRNSITFVFISIMISP